MNTVSNSNTNEGNASKCSHSRASLTVHQAAVLGREGDDREPVMIRKHAAKPLAQHHADCQPHPIPDTLIGACMQEHPGTIKCNSLVRACIERMGVLG